MEAAEEGVKEARPDGFSDKNLHVGVASVEPGTGALRGFYGGQDYLKSQINWAVAGGMAGLDVQAVRAGDRAQGRLLAQGHLRRATRRTTSPTGTGTVNNEGTGPDGLGNDYGAAVNADLRDRGVDQHRVRRHDQRR